MLKALEYDGITQLQCAAVIGNLAWETWAGNYVLRYIKENQEPAVGKPVSI